MQFRSLPRVVAVIVALSIVASVPLAFAGTSSLTYTAGQSTVIQNQLIPKYNADHCQRFGLPGSCLSTDLVTAGCNPATTTVKTVVQDSCTIFTADVTGEANFLKEVANIGLVTVYNRLIATDVGAYNAAECSRFKALSQVNQNTECTTRGLSAGCAGPCP